MNNVTLSGQIVYNSRDFSGHDVQQKRFIYSKTAKFGINLSVITEEIGILFSVLTEELSINLAVYYIFCYICCNLQNEYNYDTTALHNAILSKNERNKVIVILGARQVGKTTMIKQLLPTGSRFISLNCDDLDDLQMVEDKTSTELKSLFENYDFVFIDEAQRIHNVGLMIKKLGDLKLSTKIIVTGSSSFDLSNDINEPATGRTIDYKLYPLSATELASHTSEKEETRMLSHRLIFGYYPEVVTYPAESKEILLTLTNNYLYKDLLSYKGIKKPVMLQKLARALALQVGSEVSYNELSNLIGIDKETVENYIDLLEKCFIVFRIDSYSNNKRNEIKKGKKVYFYDNGIRNAITANFSPIDLRTDAVALWENFIISERIKRNAYQGSYAQLYFWRTTEQSEIDLIEEYDGKPHAYEFKFNSKRKAKIPTAFINNYPDTTLEVITPDNFWSFLH